MRIWTAIATLMAVFCAPALAYAQTVFFDDFEGDALLPHWVHSPDSAWAYNVNDSMLNVTALYSPSNPKVGGNYADLAAQFAPLTDFQVDVWMGWEPGDQPHRLTMNLLGPFGGGPIIASFGYRNMGPPDPVIFAGPGDAPLLTIPAPPPGMHHFTITRFGSQISFYLNGSALASFEDNWGFAAAGIHFEFLGPYPGQLGAFHIDEVQVIPTPGMLGLFILPLLRATRRRR